MKKIGDKRALYFSKRLREKVSGLRRVILFGSRARGDEWEKHKSLPIGLNIAREGVLL